jgi:hypothetical protein
MMTRMCFSICRHHRSCENHKCNQRKQNLTNIHDKTSLTLRHRLYPFAKPELEHPDSYEAYCLRHAFPTKSFCLSPKNKL